LNRTLRAIVAVAGLGLMLAPANGNAQLHPPGRDKATIALLVDLSSGQQLHAREETRRFLPASVTKVMTAFLAFELIEDGKLTPQQVFTVRPETAREWSGTGSSMFVLADQRISVDVLLHGITTVSANDGCVVLAEGAAGSLAGWVAMMNAKARELGMHDSYFGSPNGFPDGGKTFTSARDLVTLADALISRHPALYKRYFGHETFSFNGYTQRNHEPLTGSYPGGDGIKTGYTREAGATFLGTAERNGRRLALVVVTPGNGIQRARTSREYLDWGFTMFESHPLFADGDTVGSARVQEGDRSEIPLVVARDIGVTMPAGQDVPVSLAIRYRGPLRAPLRKGEQVARLEVSGEGIETFNVPLYAGEAVKRANPFRRMLNGLVGLTR